MDGFNLKIGTTEKLLAAWGMSGVSLAYLTQAADELRFMVRPVQIEDDPVFPFDSLVSLYYTSGNTKTRWFKGYVKEPVINGTDRTENTEYTVKGIWDFFDNYVFQQTWKSYAGPNVPLANVNLTHALLGISVSQVRETNGQVIAEAVNWAIANGCPLQLDTTNFPAVFFPCVEVRDVTVAEVIRTMLKYSPDHVTWLDYTTEPPTFKCQPRAMLPSVSVPVDGTGQLERVSITPLYNLQRPAVFLTYETTVQLNGKSFTVPTVDKWPSNCTGTEYRALLATINVTGWNATQTSAALETVPVDITNLSWWVARLPELAQLSNVSFTAFVPGRNTGLANELLNGQVADWMGFTVADDVAVAEFLCVGADGSVKVVRKYHRFKATNAQTGTYNTVTSFTEGEYIPANLAQNIYNSLAPLQWQVDLQSHAQECTNTIKPGVVLNCTGGRTEWLTMAALVTKVQYNLDSGTCSVSAGPPEHLSPQDLIMLLQMNRYRYSFTDPATRGSANGGGSSNLGLGNMLPTMNGTTDTSGYQKIIVKTDGGGAIQLDANDPLLKGKTMVPTLIQACTTDASGNTVNCQLIVLATPPVPMP